ncbi:MAG: magnesium transporter [Bacteroidia bacterium]|nr:magnesium transporter [Sphingobacteriaceae bacterium]MBK7309812.1 magnesium transporter [Sphingobacteriaceae bacterium]MBP9069899.1 magnesium transporter [Bacteroidia bacterium]
MPFELTSIFIDNFKDAIEQKNVGFLKEQLHELYPADIAQVLNRLSVAESSYVYELLDEDTAPEVLLELDDDTREELLAKFSAKKIAEQIDNMDSDDAADVVSELPEEMQDQVLSHMEDIEQASDIAELINYEEGTAGSLMAKELVSVYSFETVNACIDEIRKQTDNVDVMYAVYVVDNNEKFIGVLSLKKLIVSHPLARVEEIYESDAQFVKTNTSSEEVAEVMQKHDLVVLPVVDQLGRLVGRITIDDVVDVIKEAADENIQRMSGISDDVDTNDNVWRLSRARIPWLLVGMCGGIVGSRIIGTYESQIMIHPEMAYFIPLIGAMGGNVGVQSSAIIVQALANNTLIGDRIGPKLLKELSVGMVNGFICSMLILAYAFLTEDWQLSATVSVALFTVILFASFLGTFVPLTMNKFKINPALATGPFVTTLNDIIGITIYFLVGRILYGAF